jgi:hypothetical protein
MLEMLAEMVGPVELFARVALAEFVNVLKVADPLFQILLAHTDHALVLAGPRELLATVAADIDFTGFRGAVVEGSLVAR